MPLILRVDVDKPYGNSCLPKRILSKFSEDVCIFRCSGLGYLTHLKKLIQYCNKQDIKGYFFHRICTSPTKEIMELYKKGRHITGLHTENTRSFKTFSAELHLLSKLTGQNINCFTKHGSGNYKLGKHHYAPYEPEKYSEWASISGCMFHFGNMILDKTKVIPEKNNHYPYMFWIDTESRHDNLRRIEDVIEMAKSSVVPVLIHPCEYSSSITARSDFERLVFLSKKEKIDWEIPF